MVFYKYIIAPAICGIDFINNLTLIRNLQFENLFALNFHEIIIIIVMIDSLVNDVVKGIDFSLTKVFIVAFKDGIDNCWHIHWNCA